MKKLSCFKPEKPAFALSMAVLLICLLISGCYLKSTESHALPQAIKGELDLSKWRFKEFGPVNLDGEWEFYWQQLLTPEDFTSLSESVSARWISVPGSWNSYHIQDMPIGPYGYATFRLKIRNPDSVENLTLEIRKMETAYRLWINGKEAAGNGVVGMDSTSSIPFWKKELVLYNSDPEVTELILQVANFSYKRGGFHNSTKLGTTRDIGAKRDRSLLLDQFLFGALLMMGLYHLGLYFYRKNDPTALYFGLCCLLFGIRVLVMGERILVLLFNPPWEFTLMVEYLTIYLGPMMFVIFTYSLFPREIRKGMVKLAILSGVGFSLVTVFTKARVYSEIVGYFQIIIIIFGLYLTYTLIRAALAKREGIYLYLIGWIFMFLGAVNDILYTRELITFGFLDTIVFFLFILFHSVVMAKRFSRAFSLTEELTEALEEKVDERTRELAVKNSEQKTLLHVLCHDLANPLASIKGTLEFSEEDESIIQKMRPVLLTATENGLELINLIRKISALEEGKYEVVVNAYDVETLISSSLAIMNQRITEKGIRIGIEVEGRLKAEVEQISFVNSVLNNLLSNAIKFSDQDSVIELRAFSLNGSVVLEIKDQGIGIPGEMISRLFEMDASTSRAGTRGEKGTGYGMQLVRRFVESYGGSIDIQSKDIANYPEDHGTTVKLTLKKG